MANVLFGRAVDSPLDPHGKQQAQALGRCFAGWKDLLIQASPRQRARQTAAPIAAAAGCEAATADALDEVDFGRWAGASFATLAQDADWRRWNEQRSRARTPAGDSMSAVQMRVIRHLRRLHDDHPGRTIAVVSHAEVIRAALMYCLGAPLDDYTRFEISPASCTTISMERDRIAVHGVNETAPSPTLPLPAGEGAEISGALLLTAEEEIGISHFLSRSSGEDSFSDPIPRSAGQGSRRGAG